MAVSANTLFHFTSIEGLKGILSSQGFFCQYSDEHFENILPKNSHYRFTYIPMTSFCDLTIMQLSNDSAHRESFGEFGIGLKKEWGIKNRVSPVMYVHEKSIQTQRLHGIIKKINNKMKQNNENNNDNYLFVSSIADEMVDSFKYIKPYKGLWHKGRKRREPLTYYNEREWRYCPLLSEYAVLSGLISENKNEKEKINQILKKKTSLEFSPDDVKFIILRNKENISEIASTIKKMAINAEQKNELITKIITFEEIKEDF